MKNTLLTSLFMTLSLCVYAQNSLTIHTKDSQSLLPIQGVVVEVTHTDVTGVSDQNGTIQLNNIPNGSQQLYFHLAGYTGYTKQYQFPLTDSLPMEVFLVKEEAGALEDLEEIFIASTRTTRSIKNTPSRIEFIGGEELDEKGNMKPGDIRMLLSESTGIYVQTTSATSANASIRIQGLDGRYTQILKDGFPIYSGAASGLGLLQIPPLDLKQVEVIKGSSSTLYGGGAIAGLVNLISKTPTEQRELRFHLNATSAKGGDINGYYGQKFGKLGVTLFASHNRNGAYDPADIGLTAIPKFERFVFNPKLFVYFNENTSLNFGVNATTENRLGGDMKYIKGKQDDLHSYFEKNKTQRYATQFVFDHQINENNRIQVKNSVSYFNRNTAIPAYAFEGTQTATFTEVSYNKSNEKMEWVAGINLWTDVFKERELTPFPLRDYNQATYGGFIQNTMKLTHWVEVETGIRMDYVADYGAVFLPRISSLFRIYEELTSRVGGGFGYKTPTIFTEESERIQYQNVKPISDQTNTLEKSYGANADINYKTFFGDDWTLNINHLFFYTYLNNPLVLEQQSDKTYQFLNSKGHIRTQGMETNIKLGYDDFNLFLGYTYTDAKLIENKVSKENPLTPKHRINSVLMYEIEEKWKIGLEAYYFGSQQLNDGARGRDYWTCGFMIEKLWEKLSIYANFENFLDTRQTRFETIYTGSVANPTFKDIYAPLDGFVINAGIKFKI